MGEESAKCWFAVLMKTLSKVFAMISAQKVIKESGHCSKQVSIAFKRNVLQDCTIVLAHASPSRV